MSLGRPMLSGVPCTPEITTVEGLVKRVSEGLQQDQDSRRAEAPQLADQIDGFIVRLTELLEVSQPFTLEVLYCSEQTGFEPATFDMILAT